MKVYVAGSSLEFDRAAIAMQAVQAAGHTLAHDWISEIEQAGAANPVDAGLDQRKCWATKDLNQVYGSDLFWFLVPQTRTSGAWVELGCALTWHSGRVVSSGPNPEQSIFTALVDHHFGSDQEAAAWLATQRNDR